MKNSAQIAYFSMEIALESPIPTYAGGLGILAGDTLRSAADMAIPMVAISLLHRKGYFHQYLDATGWQTEESVQWHVDDYLQRLDSKISVNIEGRQVMLCAWQYDVKGVDGQTVPVYLLDSDLEENSEVDRTLTHHLYGGDAQYRLSQEVILGIGGIRMLRALGYHEIQRYHMNEGHAALLGMELLAEITHESGATTIEKEHIDQLRHQCVFTTHTPVPAGHDKFPLETVYRVLGPDNPLQYCEGEFCPAGELNMTYLALNNSHFINGVAKRHRQISQEMFTGYHIEAITNGIHAGTWASKPFQALFDRHIAGWRSDYASLRYAISIPHDEIWSAHCSVKRQLIEQVNRISNSGLDMEVLTLGFARRATAYKRLDLIFEDVDRLQTIVDRSGPLQLIFAGKAHPHDQPGKQLIQRIFRMRENLRRSIKICYLPEYDMALAKLLIAGSDIWLNTPQPPLEASGTSGMKAAVNGVPSLSIPDGWWIEGCIEDVTGWSFGNGETSAKDNRSQDARQLYDKLEQVILPLYYHERGQLIDIMRNAIAINGSFFNTERMLNQYISKAYFK